MSLHPQSDDLDRRTKSFELFVGKGFDAFEVASVIKVLSAANVLLATERFTWSIVSDQPGLLTGRDGMLLRAEPAIPDHGFSDVMIVPGGRARPDAWRARARRMQRMGRGVVLLSDAATAYIKSTRNPPGKVTTHWRDVATLQETGHYENLTNRFAETSGGIITAAGQGATAELIISLLADVLSAPQIAELGSQLLLHTIRKADAEQPKDMADNASLFDARVTQAIKLMEESISEPLSMAELTAKAGLSTRHLERVFRKVFDETPARFYKRLRARRARAMIEETLLPLMDIAIATGFGSPDTLAKAVREEYGMTPSKMRARRKVGLMSESRD
ncbi:MAG: helix-turn-helix domain-containing protein [Litoreibacter sp.]|nr:helix-turn-helix domain-containing protein [Litoreibacter sp.]MCY4336889.1 helix-turn-helix domain-containing protein [Litoreibacter sp.]